ncbi:Hypothetical protein FKW44_005555 [Caligus rogercresseyi]|uniref:Uncharacterized protein n=1 Tax=Caligus rogercresseyi TaxID=217165 RepID=A0A7T8KC57_CALRO|nr:Hypothetical protein FKW44_005555 [Caligus rogercresseyi]
MEALSLVLRSVDLGAENEGELSRAKALLSLLSELKKKRSDLMKDLKVSEGKVEASEIRAQDLERKNRLLSLQVNGYEEQLNKMKELLSKNDEQLAKR